MKILQPAVLLTFAALCGCVPTMETLRTAPAYQQFTVPAPLSCLYGKAVESVSGDVLFANYTWYAAPDGKSAWIRQPMALLTLSQVSDTSTAVELRQTANGRRFGQGEDVANLLKTNPCASKAS